MSEVDQMNDYDSPADWVRWDAVLRSIVSDMKRNDFEAALRQVDAFLSDKTIPEVRSSAIGMRAYLEEELGDLEGAKQDLLAARLLVAPGFGRYVHEVCLAGIYLKQAYMDESLLWYRIALNTCLEANMSGGAALKKLLEVKGVVNFTEEDRKLFFSASAVSWRVLGLPGDPNFTDLEKVALAIADAEANPPRASAR
jgi:hypothetical protein